MDKYPGLPHIEPDPAMQITSWGKSRENPLTQTELLFRTNVRRAFIQMLVGKYAIGSVEELREAIYRRFGAKPTAATTVADMKLIGIVRVPIPGGGSRLKLVNQIANVNIEDELNERIRIDALNMRKSERQMMIEMNRGTANTMVQLINLLVDEGGRPGVIAVTTDTDKWVVIHFENGYQATSWFEWLNGKLY